MIELLEQLFAAWAAFERAQAEAAEAAARIENAFQGWLTDLSLLPQLYVWYQQIAARHRFCGDRRNDNHKQFVFVVLLLYAPEALCGGRINSSLRREVAALLHLRSPTILYHLRDKAVAWHKAYRTFADETALAYDEIVCRLRERGVEL